jgi:Cof subfamily protein (haloacid dehalogenase superfamily)
MTDDRLPTLPVDLRLVAVDMDGTLLDADGQIPAELWPLLAIMRERGIVFAPASGRQYATLRELFERDAKGMTFIAENGTFVVQDDKEMSSTPLDANAVNDVLDAMDALTDRGGDVGVVVCGRQRAFVQRADEPFLNEVRKYYVSHEIVADLRAVDEEAIKVAIFDFSDAATSAAPALDELAADHEVVLAGAHWVDVMARGANKGVALQALQARLGIGREQTAAFGDNMNDLEMIEAADLSFAMANARSAVKRAAKYDAPHHADGGVITVLSALLGSR